MLLRPCCRGVMPCLRTRMGVARCRDAAVVEVLPREALAAAWRASAGRRRGLAGAARVGPMSRKAPPRKVEQPSAEVVAAREILNSGAPAAEKLAPLRAFVSSLSGAEVSSMNTTVRLLDWLKKQRWSAEEAKEADALYDFVDDKIFAYYGQGKARERVVQKEDPLTAEESAALKATRSR
mmetsp:Transcript_106764/g.289413  ORF Transcript_106764/g.289413 Transcript_106764/m.289413 type:complete len:180 (+) Transcript_106764:52-591(+)